MSSLQFYTGVTLTPVELLPIYTSMRSQSAPDSTVEFFRNVLIIILKRSCCKNTEIK